MKTGAPNEALFPRKRGRAPAFSRFARLSPALFFCAGLVIAPLPAMAQFSFGGFGIGGGLGVLGLMHHGYGGGFGSGRGRQPPGFMSYGFQGRSSWGRQGSPFSVYRGGQRYYHSWRSYQQPSRGGTWHTGGFPTRGICNDGICTRRPIYHLHRRDVDPPPVIAVHPILPPPVIAHTNPPPRTPTRHIVNQAGPPPPQAPPPTNAHAAQPPPTKPPRVAQAAPAPPPLRPISGVPAKDEHRYVPDEVLFEVRAGASPQTADEIARPQRLQRLASQPLELIGTTLYRYKIKDKRSVPAVVAALERDARIAAVQPNYLYRLQDEPNGRLGGNQYAGPKMRLTEAHTISNGEKTLVAVIDSGIDSAHPEILGTITESYDAINGGKGEKALHGTEAAGIVHGTEVAGIIASHASLMGVAPQTHILAVRAFKGGGKIAVVGETFDILNGIEWAVVRHDARVINMSFGGPPDPLVSREIAGGASRGVIVVASVGNEGKAAKPSYPAAYENVIPVTATDRLDAIFKDASRCTTTCVAAPGVDIFAAAPAGAYRYDSGTSMAAAQVSGLVALLLDAKPGLDPKAVLGLLVKTAKHLILADPDGSSIAGIVDAYAMLEAAAALRPPEVSVSATRPAKPSEALAENATSDIAGRSVAVSNPAGRPSAKDAELPRNAPPVDKNPTGSVKPDMQPDSQSLPTATDAELTRKEEVLWQLKKDGSLSLEQFQRQLQDLETAKTIFINKCPAAPHLPGIITAEFQESDRARAIALIRDYGLEAKLIDSVALTKITVPAGKEWFWVDILQASGLFTQVGREDYYCPKSVDTTFGIGHPDIALPAPTANIPPTADLEDVVAILKKKYPKPSEVRVVERHQNLVKIEINGLHGSILSGHNYWERLEIHLILLKPGEAEAMVEGTFAPGIGDSPPATSAYESMEKEYYSDLLKFTKATFANLQ